MKKQIIIIYSQIDNNHSNYEQKVNKKYVKRYVKNYKILTKKYKSYVKENSKQL